MTRNTNCDSCVVGSNFEKRKHMSSRSSDEWYRHKKLDKVLDDLGVDCLDYQKELLHRLIESPNTNYTNCRPRVVYCHEVKALRTMLIDKISKTKLTEEADDTYEN